VVSIRLALAGALTTLLLACGGQAAAPPAADTTTSGDIPDTQAYVVVTPSAAPYTVKVPEGWSRTESGSAITFTSRLDSVRIETQPAAQAPTAASATSGEVPGLRGAVTSFALQDVTPVHLTAGDAVRIRYQGESRADPVTGKTSRLAVERYELWRGGVEAVLTLSAPTGADNVDPWSTIANSFTWR
jgi:hypothetical protein